MVPRQHHSPYHGDGPQVSAPGDSRSEPINKIPKTPREVVKSEEWFNNLLNMALWCFYAWAAQIWLLLPAFLGDFEAWFWYMKTHRDLLPESVALASEQYFNRQNGLVISYKNTSYYPAPTNWTTFADEDKNDSMNLSNPFVIPPKVGGGEYHHLDFSSTIKTVDYAETTLLSFVQSHGWFTYLGKTSDVIGF